MFHLLNKEPELSCWNSIYAFGWFIFVERTGVNTSLIYRNIALWRENIITDAAFGNSSASGLNGVLKLMRPPGDMGGGGGGGGG